MQGKQVTREAVLLLYYSNTSQVMCVIRIIESQDRITIPAKLVIRRLFLPCLSIKEDAIVVPTRRLKSSNTRHCCHLGIGYFLELPTTITGKHTKNI